MKWLISVRRLLNSQRYHLHGGSNRMGLSKYYRLNSSSLFSWHYYSTNINKVDLEIISRETIKPASPTPPHLRTFNLSIIDQAMYDVYTPLILFLPNANNNADVTKRLTHLKETLSDVLTRFYPLAGKFKNNLHIECNDDGLNYIEARVNQTLQDFLGNPYDEQLRELTPESPESSIGNYVVGIQVNIFKCGGIGLGMSFSHKIFDGHTIFLFMKAWAAAARGSPENISPSFAAFKIFPNNPSLEYCMPSKLLCTRGSMLSTKRFVFDSTALALLKAQPVANASSAKQPTRMEATTAVIRKAAAKAAYSIRPFTPQSPHVVLSAVNIRERASPPLPKNSIGNLIDVAGAICFPGSQLDLPTLMGELRESIAKINSNHIESLKGGKGHETFNELLRMLKHMADVTNVGDCMISSSLLNSGIYEIDFGWGKPVWFYAMNPGFARIFHLNDMLKGGGVEAIVTLSPEEMEIFERDHELLSFATVNPSPLRELFNETK